MSRTVNYLIQEFRKDPQVIENMSLSEFKAWCLLQEADIKLYQEFLDMLVSYELYDQCAFVKILIDEKLEDMNEIDLIRQKDKKELTNSELNKLILNRRRPY